MNNNMIDKGVELDKEKGHRINNKSFVNVLDLFHTLNRIWVCEAMWIYATYPPPN